VSGGYEFVFVCRTNIYSQNRTISRVVKDSGRRKPLKDGPGMFASEMVAQPDRSVEWIPITVEIGRKKRKTRNARFWTF
jgi:hypothetical protein